MDEQSSIEDAKSNKRNPETAEGHDLDREEKMTLLEARTIPWPFDELKRPMGVLFDDGMLTARDLRWALQQAQDGKIRQAAKTLLQDLLFAPSSAKAAGALRVIERPPPSANRRRGLTAVGGLLAWSSLVAGILGLVSLVVGLGIGYLPDSLPSLYFLLPGLFFLLLAAVFIELASFYLRELEQTELRRECADEAIVAFRALLPAPWVLIRGFSSRRAGIDLLLIGLGGIWVFKVISRSEVIPSASNAWFTMGKRRWQAISLDLSPLALWTAAQVKRYAEEGGLPPVPVQAVIILAGKDSKLDLPGTGVSVWRLDELPDKLEELQREQRLSPDQIARYLSAFEGTFAASQR